MTVRQSHTWTIYGVPCIICQTGATVAIVPNPPLFAIRFTRCSEPPVSSHRCRFILKRIYSLFDARPGS